MRLSRQLLVLFFITALTGCSLQPDPIRLAPTLSGGWRKDNIMVVYQNQYPANQITQMLISNGINGWERIDYKHQDGKIFDIMSQSQVVLMSEDNSQRTVKSYLSLQLNPDETVKSVAYWHDEQPSVWAMDKLNSYKKLFKTSQLQAQELKRKEQRLWYGEIDLANKHFTPCGYQDHLELEVDDKLIAKNIQGWQKIASKNKLWIALIGSDGTNGAITLVEQLLVQPPRPSNCSILKSIGRP